jgi:hypothetical protein
MKQQAKIPGRAAAKAEMAKNVNYSTTYPQIVQGLYVFSSGLFVGQGLAVSRKPFF